MDRDLFWHILSKIKSGEASPEEQLAFNQHLANNPGDAELLTMVDALWDVPFQTKGGSGENETKQAWNKFQKRIEPAIAQVNPMPGSNVKRIAIFLVKAVRHFLNYRRRFLVMEDIKIAWHFAEEYGVNKKWF